MKLTDKNGIEHVVVDYINRSSRHTATAVLKKSDDPLDIYRLKDVIICPRCGRVTTYGNSSTVSGHPCCLEDNGECCTNLHNEIDADKETDYESYKHKDYNHYGLYESQCNELDGDENKNEA